MRKTEFFILYSSVFVRIFLRLGGNVAYKVLRLALARSSRVMFNVPHIETRPFTWPLVFRYSSSQAPKKEPF
jgi:hypothetical protein